MKFYDEIGNGPWYEKYLLSIGDWEFDTISFESYYSRMYVLIEQRRDRYETGIN